MNVLCAVAHNGEQHIKCRAGLEKGNVEADSFEIKRKAVGVLGSERQERRYDFRRGIGSARMEDERSGNTGSPVSGVSTHQLVIREEWTGLAVWRIGP